jgi:DNA-binding GntR family transcriptional regulator
VTLGPRRSSLSTATRRVLADEVVDAIRTAIVTGAIEAGTRLIEDELAAQLRVSRSPVREALVRLELEGLVVTERYKERANDIRQAVPPGR